MKNLLITLLALISLQAKAAGTQCGIVPMQAELEEMKDSEYWTNLKDQFASQMNQTYPRGCSFNPNEQAKGLEIFMDDLEFTGPSDSSRVLAYSGDYGTEWGSANGQDEFYLYGTDSAFYQPGVSEIRFYLKEGHMNLLAKTCSPKVALANLIAYTPYVMQAHCGAGSQDYATVVKAIESKVQEILAGGK